MTRDAIELLTQQVEVLHNSIDELRTAFEHAVRNGDVDIRIDVHPSLEDETELNRGNGNGSNESRRAESMSPTPDRLF